MTDLERIAKQRALHSLYDLSDACRLAQDQWQHALDTPTSLEDTPRSSRRGTPTAGLSTSTKSESYLHNNR